MKERLKNLRKELDMTQQELADKLGTARNNIAGYETGKRQPSDAVISLICKTEFSKGRVNELWLRTGEGTMFVEPTKNDQIAAMIADVLVGENEFKKKLIAALAAFDESDWEKFESVLDKIIQGMNEKKEE